MQIRIRHISRRRKGLVVQNEQVTDRQSLNIGRATDQDIFLSDLGVAYRHARLTLSASGQIGVSSLTPAGIYVNGRLSQSANMKSGGNFQVGPYNIVVTAAQDGFDFDVTVEQIAEDFIEKQSEELPAMRLEDTWLSRRGGAWVGFVLVLALFLALPLAGVYDENVRELSRSSALLPDDGAWISGDISAPHKHFAEDCNACHTDAFVMTPDKACVKCHATTTAHADPEFFDLHALQGARCATCHKEHNGDDYIVRADQQLCSDCHGELGSLVQTRLADVADFSSTHPEFMPLLYKVDASGEGDWKRIELNTRAATHSTGLKFPHDVHLDVNGLESPTGNKVLFCSDCHQTDAGKSYMLPIEFELHCQECHNLTFDPSTPERELPHSNLDAMSSTLDEFYAFMALRGGYANDEDTAIPDIVTRRRIPGKELTPVQRRTALDWAQQKAAEVKEEVIEFRACGYCHTVQRDNSANSGWRIPKVRISQRWYTKGLFDHASHVSSSCQSCHEADKSDNSEQLLMPDINSCRECHGDQHSEDKLQSGCISCHVFHVPGNVLLGDRGG